MKRRRKNPNKFAGKPGKYLRGDEPNIASHGDWWEKLIFSPTQPPSGSKNNIILYSYKKIEGKWTAFILEIPSRLVHFRATEGLKK